MINSLMSRMAEAQKLSIPQLQQSIQDGTLPAYVGIPLLQDKVKQAQMAKATQQAPAQPPVAQQVMQAANQVERGVDSLPSNLEGMAEGGIETIKTGIDAYKGRRTDINDQPNPDKGGDEKKLSDESKEEEKK